jgi:hypothetical protein
MSRKRGNARGAVPDPPSPEPDGPLGEGASIPTGLLSAADLASRLHEDRAAVESFLRRLADKNPDCRQQTGTDRRNEPKWLYRVSDVWPALTEWAQQRRRTGRH